MWTIVFELQRETLSPDFVIVGFFCNAPSIGANLKTYSRQKQFMSINFYASLMLFEVNTFRDWRTVATDFNQNSCWKSLHRNDEPSQTLAFTTWKARGNNRANAPELLRYVFYWLQDYGFVVGTLKMEAAYYSETVVWIYQTARRHIP
jgi:hypothetical protein